MTHLLYVGSEPETLAYHLAALKKARFSITKVSSHRAARMLRNDVDAVILHETAGSSREHTADYFRRRTMAQVVLVLDGVPPRRSEAHEALTLPTTPARLMRAVSVKPPPVTVTAGGLTLDITNQTVQNGGPAHPLTPMQARLLLCLMESAGRIVERREIMRQVWQTEYIGDMRTLHVHIRWLREKIEPNPKYPRYLTTIRGVGYRLAWKADHD